MKEFTVKIEVDDNITAEDIGNGIVEMGDNMATTECFYEIEETRGQVEKDHLDTIEGDDRWFNPDIDMTKIVSSMQIDSETEICALKRENYEVSIRTAGEVKIFVGENDYFTNPSDFPDALKDLIKEHPNDFDSYAVEKGPVQGDIYVSENNWFEIFFYKDGECLSSDVVDIEGQTEEELFDLMDNSMTDWVKAYEERRRDKAEKEVRESLSPDQKRKIYDEVKIELLTEDVINHLEDEDLFISEEDAGYIATQIVEEGEWDANLSHWSNIDNAVEKYESDIELSSLEGHMKDEVLNEMINEDIDL